MKKIFIILFLLFAGFLVKAQTNPFPTTDSLERFINRYIRNSPVEAFQNLRMNTSLIGMLRFIQNGGIGGNKLDSVTIKTATDPAPDTLYQWRAAVKTLVGYLQKSSGGSGGGPNLSVGGGFRWVVWGTQNIKSAVAGYGQLIDTLTANVLTFKADTSGANGLVTRTEIRDSTDRITIVEKPVLVNAGANNSISDTVTVIYDNLWVTINGDSALTADTTKFSEVYLRRKDSVTSYVTPTRLNDTAAAIREAFEGATAVEIPLPQYDWRSLNILNTYNGEDAYPLVKLLPASGARAMIWPNDDSLRMHAYDSIRPVSHPSIEYVAGGWNGFPYWMAYAPYPSEIRENPSIEASTFGTIWRTPPGATNPVEPEPPGAPTNYNSDVDLVYTPSDLTMRLFWRYETGAGVSQHYYRESTDGVNWINKTLLIPSGAGASPTFLNKFNLWHMYDVDYTTHSVTQDPFIINYRFSPTLAGLKASRKYRCTITGAGIPAGKHAWHIQMRWSELLNQMVALINCTTINPGGAPNNGGVLIVAFSTDFVTFNVGATLALDPNVYRSTFIETPAAIRQGAIGKVVMNNQWYFTGDSTVLLFVKPNTAVPTFSNYDSLETKIGRIFGTRYRLSSFYGLPPIMIRRSSDDSTMHLFPGSDNTGLYLKDGTPMATWLGGASAYVVRLYNQVSSQGDYITFTGTGQPLLKPTAWNGTTSYGIVFDGVDDLGGAYKALGTKGIIAAMSLDTGRAVSRLNTTTYAAALNGTLETLLAGANINHENKPSPLVRSFIYNGSTSRIRNNGALAAAGSITNPTGTGQMQLGAFWGGASFSQYYKGIITEIVTFNTDTASAGALTNIENLMMSEYAYDQDSLLYDTYTDVDATNVTSHTANLGGSYTASDANWVITSNTLRRGAAGSGQPTAVLIKNGYWNGIVSGDVTPGGSGGSGLVWRHLDNTHFYYVRVFGGTTLGIFKHDNSGSATLVGSTAAVTAAGQWSARVEVWGNRIQVYLNGATTPTLTATDASWSSWGSPAVGYGFYAATGDTPTSAIFDNLKFYPWIN